jgi:transcriptional regulator with XRE-family HTH domain
MTTFGECIRKLREEHNLSLRDLSTMLHVDSSLISKIERNERQPTKDFIKQVAAYFKIDEKGLINESLSDFFANKIIYEDVDLEVLKVAEEKVNYLKSKK